MQMSARWNSRMRNWMQRKQRSRPPSQRQRKSRSVRKRKLGSRRKLPRQLLQHSVSRRHSSNSSNSSRITAAQTLIPTAIVLAIRIPIAIAAITIPAATITTATQRPARITTIAAAATAALVLHGRVRGSIPFPAAMSHVGVHSTALWILPAETMAQPLSLLVAVPLLWLSADARITTASPPAAAAAAAMETMW